MTTRRVMGIETEYGVSVPGQPASGAMVASSQVVNGWASGMAEGPARSRRTRWDFEEENPLRDARGFDVGAGLSDHELEDDLGPQRLALDPHAVDERGTAVPAAGDRLSHAPTVGSRRAHRRLRP